MAADEYVRLPIYLDELARAVGFTSGDLELNRAGRLSSEQRRSLECGLRPRVVGAAVCLACAVGALVGIVAFRPPQNTGAAFLALAGLAGFCGVLIASGAARLSQDLKGSTVRDVEGYVTSSESATHLNSRFGPHGTFLRFVWSVGGDRFVVPGRAYAVLAPAHYRLFFLPRTRRIVALEPLVRSDEPTRP